MPDPDACRRRAVVFSRLAFIGLLLVLLSACDVTLYSDLPEQDANEMLAVLSSNGIRTSKNSAGKGMWYVTVDEKLLPKSLEVLAANGLPRSVYKDMGDIFKKDSMVSTPVEERARLVYAISQELAGTIATLDGVLAARVHLVLPELDNFGNKISPSKASIFIKHRVDADLAPQVTHIKRLVENSVRDLTYESISVFLFASTVTPPVPATPTASVLGFSVEQDNAPRAWLAVILAALALAGAAFWGWKRLAAKKQSD